MDDLTNLATGVVALAPVPAASGTTLTVGPGQGARFPAPPFNATIWPARYVADPENAEIVRVTAKAGDVLTVARGQEGTLPVAIQQGYRLDAAPTLKFFLDILARITALENGSGPGPGPGPSIIGSGLTMPFVIGGGNGGFNPAPGQDPDPEPSLIGAGLGIPFSIGA